MIDEYPYMGKCCYSYDCNQFVSECPKCTQHKSYPPSLFMERPQRLLLIKIFDRFVL